jgi:hypothetical protein
MLSLSFQISLSREIWGLCGVFELGSEPVAGPGYCIEIVSNFFGEARELRLLEFQLTESSRGGCIFLFCLVVFLDRGWASFRVHSGQFLQLGIDAVRERATLMRALKVLTPCQNKRTSDQSQRNSHAWTVRSIAGHRCTRFSLALPIFFLARACQRSDEPPLPNRLPRQTTTLNPEASVSAGDAGNPWLKHQLDDLRDRTLKWTPRDEAASRVVFAGERVFAQLGSEVLSLDAAGKAELLRYPVDGPHQLSPFADGSVLGVGPKSTFRIRPGAKKPDALNKVLLLPQNQLYASASDAARFDVLDVVTGQWTGYRFEEKPNVSSVWLPDNTFDVPELKFGHCAQLLDGGYGCFANDQLWRLNSRSRPKSMGKCGVGLPVWRVLGAARADQLWVARTDGRLEKWWFGPPLKQLSVIQLPWTPLDVSIQKDTVAVIRILQERAKPKQISLVVMDIEGRTRFEKSLLPNFEAESSSIDQELRESEVTVHSKRPWIAIRNPRGIRLLNAMTGETLVEAR